MQSETRLAGPLAARVRGGQARRLNRQSHPERASVPSRSPRPSPARRRPSRRLVWSPRSRRRSAGCASAPSNEQRSATLQSNGVAAADLPATGGKVGTVFTGRGLHLDRKVFDYRGRTGGVHVEHVVFAASDGADCKRGCVTAIDRRGYYLTAAHAVGGDPLWVLCGVDVRPARVVFRGDADFDVAVLSVDRPIPDAFDWAAPDRWPAGARVLEAGPTDPSGGLAMQDFAGRVCRVEDAAGADGPYQTVTSSLPARHGDSGRPGHDAGRPPGRHLRPLQPVVGPSRSPSARARLGSGRWWSGITTPTGTRTGRRWRRPGQVDGEMEVRRAELPFEQEQIRGQRRRRRVPPRPAEPAAEPLGSVHGVLESVSVDVRIVRPAAGAGRRHGCRHLTPRPAVAERRPAARPAVAHRDPRRRPADAGRPGPHRPVREPSGRRPATMAPPYGSQTNRTVGQAGTGPSWWA